MRLIISSPQLFYVTNIELLDKLNISFRNLKVQYATKEIQLTCLNKIINFKKDPYTLIIAFLHLN